MIKLTDYEISKYFYRSYTAVDGLWFLKVEEKYGFGAALNIDNEVWKVMPKIQARFLKSKIKEKLGLDALFETFTTKLKLDGFKFKAEKENNNIIKIIISDCPWHNTMIKSNRAEFSEKVGSRICNTEYKVWSSEFGKNISFELKDQICRGSKSCRLIFLTN